MSPSSDTHRSSGATRVARVFAGTNGVYQAAVGLLSMVAPATAAMIYHLAPPLPATTLALTRILGGMMVANAMGLAIFTLFPARHPVLAPLLLAGAGLGVLAAALPCTLGELQWSQMAGSLLFQMLLAIGLAAHLRSRSAASIPQSA